MADKLLFVALTDPGPNWALWGSDGRPGNTSPQQRLADMFFNTFDDPNSFAECLTDLDRAKARIRDVFGTSPARVDLKGKLRIAKGQVRQLVGMPRSEHPLARMKP